MKRQTHKQPNLKNNEKFRLAANLAPNLTVETVLLKQLFTSFTVA